jgi:hypothetical protein
MSYSAADSRWRPISEPDASKPAAPPSSPSSKRPWTRPFPSSATSRSTPARPPEGEETEQPVVGQHTAEVKDIEHNELRALANAMRTRINGANDSLLAAEATDGLAAKKVFRYKREVKKPKFSNARLARLLGQLEKCEHYQVVPEGERMVVKFEINGMNGMSYLKAEELEELEKALENRPEITHRRRE